MSVTAHVPRREQREVVVYGPGPGSEPRGRAAERVQRGRRGGRGRVLRVRLLGRHALRRAQRHARVLVRVYTLAEVDRVSEDIRKQFKYRLVIW